MIDPQQHIHFVGIGGAGMSALAQVLLARGYMVSGCDTRDAEATGRLRAQGVVVRIGHAPAHLTGVDVVVASRAVPAETPELLAARRQSLPVRHRAEILGAVMRGGRSIGVVGTHGKTTTAAMTATVLAEAGWDPTALVGAEVVGFGGNARVGASPWLVAEVDESDGSLVHVAPWAAVLTSLDLTDHADHYTSPAHLAETFLEFLQGVAPDGFVVICRDHPAAAALAPPLRVPVVTYGLEAGGDLTAEVRRLEGAQVEAVARAGGKRLGTLRLQVPGRHNLANALGAAAVGLRLGLTFAEVARGLLAFGGVARRLDLRGEADGVLVVDDYAHNPVKVATAIRAARDAWPGRRLIVVFQPHRFSRTQTTHAQFADVFQGADEVYITDIYPADERPVAGVTARLIVDAVRRPVHYVPSPGAAVEEIAARVHRGDLVLTLGAGDIGQAADALLSRLQARVRS